MMLSGQSPSGKFRCRFWLPEVSVLEYLPVVPAHWASVSVVPQKDWLGVHIPS